MYGDNYGYRSGLNNSMVQHLIGKANYLIELSNLQPGDVVVDIGSNDCTTLKAFPDYVKGLVLIQPLKSFQNTIQKKFLMLQISSRKNLIVLSKRIRMQN